MGRHLRSIWRVIRWPVGLVSAFLTWTGWSGPDFLNRLSKVAWLEFVSEGYFRTILVVVGLAGIAASLLWPRAQKQQVPLADAGQIHETVSEIYRLVTELRELTIEALQERTGRNPQLIHEAVAQLVGQGRLAAEGDVVKAMSPAIETDEVMPLEPHKELTWKRLYRAYRGNEPSPGNDHGAAHIGDYPSRDKAIAACRELPPEAAPYWIEPVEYNGDLAAPVYRNAGPVERVAHGYDVSITDQEGGGVLITLSSRTPLKPLDPGCSIPAGTETWATLQPDPHAMIYASLEDPENSFTFEVGYPRDFVGVSQVDGPYHLRWVRAGGAGKTFKEADFVKNRDQIRLVGEP